MLGILRKSACLGLSSGSLKDSHRCEVLCEHSNAFLITTISSTFRAILGFFGRTRSEINSRWPNPSKAYQALQIAGQPAPRRPEINSRRPDPTRALKKKSEINFWAYTPGFYFGTPAPYHFGGDAQETDQRFRACVGAKGSWGRLAGSRSSRRVSGEPGARGSETRARAAADSSPR